MIRKYTKIVVLWAFGLLVGFPLHTLALDNNKAPNSISLNAPLITTAFVPLLPFGADNSTQPQFIPVGSNHPLSEDHEQIQRAIIAIHDQNRDATAALNLLSTLTGGQGDSTLILAPQFLLEADIIRFSQLLPDHGKMFARWSLNGLASSWEDGGDSSVDAHQKGISSFSAIDVLLLYLSDRTKFPNLQQIVIVGHGTGGDFVQRYAATGQAAPLLEQLHIPLRFIIANPASYLYFTPSRPQKNKHGFAPPEAATCPSYNGYKYGLDNLNNYARKLGNNAIKLEYPTRNIMYLLGEKVVAQDTLLDDNCGAQMQGQNRMLRAENYELYLNTLFGDSDENRQIFVKVPKVGLDEGALLSSGCGMSGLFGNGSCK